MPHKEEIEVFIAMDEGGCFEVGVDYDDVSERFDENIGGYRRIVKIKVRMAPPKVATAEVEVADEIGEVSAEAAE